MAEPAGLSRRQLSPQQCHPARSDTLVEHRAASSQAAKVDGRHSLTGASTECGSGQVTTPQAGRSRLGVLQLLPARRVDGFAGQAARGLGNRPLVQLPLRCQ
jgi:hypothetical protein